jgi:hypothetical protein
MNSRMTDACHKENEMKKYQILRHSGRRDAEFRVVLDTDDAEKARQKYEDISISLRQGAVRFVRHGTIANCTSAPTLRTRW